MPRFSLYRRTVGLVAFILALTFVVLALVFSAIGVLQDRNQAHVIERNVLRANEKVNDFLRTRDTASAEEARTALLTADSLLHIQMDGDLDAALSREIRSYVAALVRLVYTMEARGLDEASGAEGRLRQNVDAAEAQVRAAGQDHILLPMLMARRAEKEYLLLRDPEDERRVDEAVEAVRTATAQSTLPAPIQASIEARITDYHRAFKRLVQDLIRVEHTRETIIEAQQSADALLARVVAQAESRANWLQRTALISTLLITLLGIGLAMWMGRSIVRPIHQLQHAAQRIVEGRDDVSVTVQRQDEFGDLAQVFNQVSQLIRERREAEEALHSSQRFVETILDHMQEGIVVYDADLRCVIFNKHLETITGLSAGYVEGRHAYKAFGQQLGTSQGASTRELLERVLDGETVRSGDLLYEHAETGARFWYVGTYAPLRNVEGEITGVVGNIHDVTMRKRSERQLVMAKEAAEEMAQLKTAFLNNMSHEMRTPLNGVLGMVSLLSDTDLSPEQREYVDIIETSGDALLAVINQVLDFSKIEAGKLALDEQSFQPARIVEETLDLVAHHADEKRLELAAWVKPNVPAVVRGDRTRIRQVLINLVSNAVKFTDDGEVTVTVASHPGVGGDLRLQFSVADTGPGIPGDQQEHLFESFRQLDASTTRTHGGTGLGLAISRGLCELMDGEMWVESTPGLGSTFYFTVMVAAEEDEASGCTWQEALRGETILLISHHPARRRMLSQVLARQGMQVHAADSLAEMPTDVSDQLVVFDVPYDVPTAPSELLQSSRAWRGLLLLGPLGCPRWDASLPRTRWLSKPAGQDALFEVLAELARRGTAPPVRSSHEDGGRQTGTEAGLDVLIAEDNAINQKLLVRLLTRLGHRSTVVGTGLEALAAAIEHSYDLVFMDVMMPEMDGLEATRCLHQEMGAECPPIVAVTASASDADRARCLDAGMVGFVPKPIQQASLAEAIEAACPAVERRPKTRPVGLAGDR